MGGGGVEGALFPWLIRVQRKGCMCVGVEMRSDEEGGVLSMEVGGITGTWGDWVRGMVGPLVIVSWQWASKFA